MAFFIFYCEYTWACWCELLLCQTRSYKSKPKVLKKLKSLYGTTNIWSISICVWTLLACLCVCKRFALNEVWPLREDRPAFKWQVVYWGASTTPIVSSNKSFLIMWKHPNSTQPPRGLCIPQCARYSLELTLDHTPAWTTLLSGNNSMSLLRIKEVRKHLTNTFKVFFLDVNL